MELCLPFEAWLLVVNVVRELYRKEHVAASRGFFAAARLSCLLDFNCCRNISLLLQFACQDLDV